ncbi:MAG: hypothetical protein IJ642_08640 [Oscillospiraceae bacterium]|nr:hypothetical protein [Oscillospiraceae bacterium]
MKIKHMITAFLSVAVCGISAISLVTSAADQYQDKRDEVIMLVNEQRTALGKSELYEAELLNQAAQLRAEEIIDNFSHIRPDGRAGYTAFTDLGGVYMAVGENIAYGYPTEADVMNGWMNSDGHRGNILNDAYHAMGVGVAAKGNVLYWVQLFSDGKNLPPLYSKGNINRDNKTDSTDASAILIDAAQKGAGMSGILNRMQISFADLNRNQLADSDDASLILRYAAYAGTGGTESIESFCGLS